MPNNDNIRNFKSHSGTDIGNSDISDAHGDVEIMDLYKKTMDNVSMSPERKITVREELATKTANGGNNRRFVKIAKFATIAAAVCAVLLCIPATRTTVSAAIDYIKQTFHLANGGEVTYEENDEGNSLTFSITTDDDNGYTKAENGRLYFVLGDTKEDITDKCGSDKYFRHEIKNDDGTRSVILIGGTPESCGWVELFFDKNGKYIFNNMNVEDYNDPWVEDAMHAEGVDSGNPYLDGQLTSEVSGPGTSEASEGKTSDTITSITIGDKTGSTNNEDSTQTTYIQQ